MRTTMCKEVLLQRPTPVRMERTNAFHMSMEEHVPLWMTDRSTSAAAEEGGF